MALRCLRLKLIDESGGFDDFDDLDDFFDFDTFDDFEIFDNFDDFDPWHFKSPIDAASSLGL